MKTKFLKITCTLLAVCMFSTIQMKAQTTTTTNIMGLTVLVNFPDKPSTFSPSFMNAFLNQTGFNGGYYVGVFPFGYPVTTNGSVRDYWREVSNNKLEYFNLVYPTYYTARYNKSYYDNNNVNNGVSGGRLAKEIDSFLVANNFSFSQVTLKANSKVKALNIIYVDAFSASQGMGLRPHAITPANAYNISPHFDTYQLTYMESFPSLGLFCHESGHQLFGWYDLYDECGTGTATGNGIGDFCLMARGYGGVNEHNPVPPNAYLRAKEGWDFVLPVTYNSADPCRECMCTANAYGSFKITNPNNANESFYLETRRKTGRNTYLPDEGLMIWHVDESKTDNCQEQGTSSQHYQVALIQADGQRHLENSVNTGDGGDLLKWGQTIGPNNNSTSHPNTRWWNGSSGTSIIVGNVYAPSNDPTHFTFDLCFSPPASKDQEITGITETNQNAVNIYPNPSSGELTINLQQEQPSTAHLYDLTGKQVFEAKLNDLSTTINISNLAAGTYILKVVSGTETYHSKLLKQ
jgi:M6 family metalloprotease-like protein